MNRKALAPIPVPMFIAVRSQINRLIWVSGWLVTTLTTIPWLLISITFFSLSRHRPRAFLPARGDTGSGNAAITATSVDLIVSGAIGRTSDLVQIDVPNGDYEQLSAENANLLSGSSSSDVAGRSYGVYKYIGVDPLITSSASTTLDLSNTSLFASYKPDYVAGSGNLYRYNGTTTLNNTDLSVVDFSSIDANGRALWVAISSGSANYDTTISSASFSVDDESLVMDTRAQLSTNQIVLVRTPAFYGYYQYKGLAARLELQQQDYSNVSLWESLTVGSQDASLTKTIIHPTTIKSGDLITDPSLLVGVTLRLNTP